VASDDGGERPSKEPIVKHIETPNEKKRRLEHEAREAEAARLAEIKRQEEAARKEEAEKQRVEQEKRDKLARKATRVEVSLRKFIGSHLKVLDSQKTVMGQKKEKPKKEKKKNDAGKKKKQPTPVQASWIEFLTELDTKINERKMCALDDVLPGFLRLTPDEQRHLTGVMQGIGKKDLPKGRDLKDNHSIIHKTLLMAVQSQQYRKPKDPIVHRRGAADAVATDLRNQGLSTAEIHNAGYKTQALRSAKCPKDEIIHAVDSLQDLFYNQIRPADIAIADSPLHKIEGYRGAIKLKMAGYTATHIKRAGTHTPWELRMAGYSLAQLKGAGYLEPSLRAAGFGDKERQPLGEGLCAATNTVPTSYEYEEMLARVARLPKEIIESGFTEGEV